MKLSIYLDIIEVEQVLDALYHQNSWGSIKAFKKQHKECFQRLMTILKKKKMRNLAKSRTCINSITTLIERDSI